MEKLNILQVDVVCANNTHVFQEKYNEMTEEYSMPRDRINLIINNLGKNII